MNAEIKRLEEKLQSLQDQRRIAELKKAIDDLEGDPEHPASEGWEWDGDLGIWEQRPQPRGYEGL